MIAEAALAELAAGNLLVALDFDGTLAPIVPRPEDAAMRPETRRLLARLAQLYPCAVVSGRAEDDLRRHLAGVTVWYAVGNHFLEPAAEREQAVLRWRPALEAAIAPLRGVTLEDKGASLALHYRGAEEHDRARAQILEAAALLDGARAIEGKEVVNVVPRGGPDKAAAVERLCAQLGCDRALYVGDDLPDEEVFALPRITGVRVGGGQASRARHFLSGQGEVDALLERLAAARARPSRSQEALAAMRRGSG